MSTKVMAMSDGMFDQFFALDQTYNEVFITRIVIDAKREYTLTDNQCEVVARKCQGEYGAEIDRQPRLSVRTLLQERITVVALNCILLNQPILKVIQASASMDTCANSKNFYLQPLVILALFVRAQRTEPSRKQLALSCMDTVLQSYDHLSLDLRYERIRVALFQMSYLHSFPGVSKCAQALFKCQDAVRNIYVNSFQHEISNITDVRGIIFDYCNLPNSLNRSSIFSRQGDSHEATPRYCRSDKEFVDENPLTPLTCASQGIEDANKAFSENYGREERGSVRLQGSAMAFLLQKMVKESLSQEYIEQIARANVTASYGDEEIDLDDAGVKKQFDESVQQEKVRVFDEIRKKLIEEDMESLITMAGGEPFRKQSDS